MASFIHSVCPETFQDEVMSESRMVLLLCMPHDDEFLRQRRIIEEVAEIFGNKLKVVLPEEAFIEVFKKTLHIVGTPTFLLFNQGKEIARILGVSDRDPLIDVIREAALTVLKENW
jgi:hypothetical protein